jgi:hypothetical protein
VCHTRFFEAVAALLVSSQTTLQNTAMQKTPPHSAPQRCDTTTHIYIKKRSAPVSSGWHVSRLDLG